MTIRTQLRLFVLAVTFGVIVLCVAIYTLLDFALAISSQQP